ncbi:MAG: hypothetical protein R2843_09045 [Thermomicrobiales bacterium]
MSSADPPHASYPLDDPGPGRVSHHRSRRTRQPVARGDIDDITGTDAMLASSGGVAACVVVLAREQRPRRPGAKSNSTSSMRFPRRGVAERSHASSKQKRLGHDLTQPHVAIIARIDQTTVARARDDRWVLLEETLTRRGSRILWRLRNNNAEIIWPAATAQAAIEAAEELHEEIYQGLLALGAQGAGRIAGGRSRPVRSWWRAVVVSGSATGAQPDAACTDRARSPASKISVCIA